MSETPLERWERIKASQQTTSDRHGSIYNPLHDFEHAPKESGENGIRNYVIEAEIIRNKREEEELVSRFHIESFYDGLTLPNIMLNS